MIELIEAVRRYIARWTITTVELTENVSAGDDTFAVRTTLRFKAGDEFIIKDEANDRAEFFTVEEIVDTTHIKATSPAQYSWFISNDIQIQKTIYGNYIRDIFIGEPSIISDYPAITVHCTNRSSEWYTIRATKERFEVEIGIFVQDANYEDGYKFMAKIADIIQKGLKKNIYPLVNDYNSTQITEDIAVNDVVIKVDSVTNLSCQKFILVENSFYAEPNTVLEIIDSNTIRVMTPFQHSFTVDDTAIIIPNRYFYNSWPSNVKFGVIHKGTLLKSASISFFAEETEIQGEGGWQDTQLS
jgi:hypothetical protein